MNSNMLMKTLIVLGLSAWMGACVGTSPPTRYYLLNPIASNEANPAHNPAQTPASLGIGPISLPDYLDRPQIVTRRNANTLHLADFDRWAGSLQPMLVRVLRENLRALLPVETLVAFPWPANAAFEYQVTADVLRLDALKGADAILVVRWAILRFEDQALLHRQESVHTRPVAGPDYADVVRSLNQVVEDFSREVAAALEKAYRRDHGW